MSKHSLLTKTFSEHAKIGEMRFNANKKGFHTIAKQVTAQWTTERGYIADKGNYTQTVKILIYYQHEI